jgi:flagellar hook assembly protein FlgD
VIRFALPTRSPVAIEVFDVHGRRVKTLAKGEWPAGFHAVNWDGRNGAGHRVHPGIYLYRMSAGSFRASRKLAVLP